MKYCNAINKFISKNKKEEKNNSNTVSVSIISCLLLFIFMLFVFWWNAAPSVTFHDSSEFAIAAESAGIPHPPGAPTWTALASLFLRIGAFNDPAHGTNLFSGLMGALTIALICLLIQLWSMKLFESLPRFVIILSGLASAAILLHSSAFLEQSFITEQYTLMTMFISFMLLVSTLILFYENQTDNKKSYLFVLLGLLWGLAIGNHLSQISLVFFVLFTVLVGVSKRNIIKSLFYVLIGLFTGLLIFLWLPLRSISDPLIDYGNIKTWDRFLWAIERKQWATRLISETPPGFVREWINSYSFREQLGDIAIVSAFIGFIYLLKKRFILAGWIILVSFPYAIGMILAHMKQAGMDISYIKSYGVADWHLPLYLAVALFAGIGISIFASYMNKFPKYHMSSIVPLIVVFSIFATAIPVISRSSLRNFHSPEEFVNMLTKTLPDNAIILPTGDNAIGLLTYWSYITHPDGRYWIAPRKVPLSNSISDSILENNYWTYESKLKYLTTEIMNPNIQPFRIDRVTDEMVKKSDIYIDFIMGYPQEAKYLLPDGFLFRVSDHYTTENEILQPEKDWRSKYPDLMKLPNASSNRLERDAWAVMHQKRGAFFALRGLWKEAAESYGFSLVWVPDDNNIQLCYADSLEMSGDFESAITVYKHIIDDAPYMPNVRMNLASLYVKTNKFGEAKQALEDELKFNPNDSDARHNLDLLKSAISSIP